MRCPPKRDRFQRQVFLAMAPPSEACLWLAIGYPYGKNWGCSTDGLRYNRKHSATGVYTCLAIPGSSSVAPAPRTALRICLRMVYVVKCTSESCSENGLFSMPNMTGQPGCQTMEMQGSSTSHVAHTVCCYFAKKGVEQKGFYPEDAFHTNSSVGILILTNFGSLRKRASSPISEDFGLSPH